MAGLPLNDGGNALPATGAAARERAAARVSAYFRALGLRDEAALQAAAERIVGDAAAGDPAPELLPGAAAARAIDAVEAWLKNIAACSSEAPADFGRLARPLRRYLGEHPERFLSGSASHEVQALCSFGAAVPPEAPLAMEAQPLGEPSSFFRRGFWRRAAASVGPALVRGCRVLLGG